jgi:hypothetical protein
MCVMQSEYWTHKVERALTGSLHEPVMWLKAHVGVKGVHWDRTSMHWLFTQESHAVRFALTWM